MTSNEIRQAFLDFFESKGHEIVPSSPLVLPSDPTLLFANAGMNQFKDIFLGARDSEHKRVADTQKCIRVSGKHNDLEEVGRDTYHHTFFEMLGNWSFGDYYKREAIEYAWELLTDVWQLPKDKLWATVFRDDDEAEQLWKEVTDIDHSHILRCGEKDNFWEMGDTGPCGPCSEIHIDLTDTGCTADMINADRPDVIELWNLVFIQYNRGSDGQLSELPHKHVDTGMGFERLCAVLQGKRSNYDTDVFMPFIDKLCAMTGREYSGEDAVAMRVAADHVRTISFAIADGVIPANDGRGYVLRRLLRRAARYGRNLGLKQPFLGELYPVLEETMGGYFPELAQNRENILRVLKAEEESFMLTIDRGLGLFEEVAEELARQGAQVFPGREAFKLYDTYGFPLDLTRLMARERGLTLDEEACEAEMRAQRERARAARDAAGTESQMEEIIKLVGEGVQTVFRGYDRRELESEVLLIVAEGETVASLSEGAAAAIVLAETPFYGEGGGQLGDHGALLGAQGEFSVEDTRKPAEGLILHIGRMTRGSLSRGEVVTARIDSERRASMARHHTATHLLNAALRANVDQNVKQAGSLVAPERFRFDFNHFESLSPEQIERLERFVNSRIMLDAPVSTFEMPLKEVYGSDIVAVFDEKYGDRVRVVEVEGVSKELCGGTHVASTGELGMFRIVSESSVAAGVRRIEAVCGWPAYEWSSGEHRLLQQLSQRFSVKPEDLEQRLESLAEKNRELEKSLKKLNEQAARGQAGSLLDEASDVDGVKLIAAVVDGQSPANLMNIMDDLRTKLDSGVIVLGGNFEGKAAFAASVSDDLVAQGMHAGKLVGDVARRAGGGGGGQPNKAQAGGKDGAKAAEAIAAVPEILEQARQ
jgi:alanyl-tRNA synthetase